MKLPTLKIGNLKLANPLILAPMVDVTDLPYRLLCRRAGTSLAFTEMLYIDAILHENKKTKNLMMTCREDSPYGLQITGNSEEEFEKFVKSGKWKDFELIDLNCGCPSLRITGNEAGSYLLRNPKKISRMIKILKKTGKPITAKIRLGFKKNNVMEVAREIEEAGADALTLHARLATDGKDVPADWSWIAKIKKNLKIPVIGNGDVFSKEDVERMFKETGCDGVMIARGAIGDPLIFERILHGGGFDKEHKSKPLPGLFDFARNLEMFKEYVKLEKRFFGDEVDLGRVKYLGGKFLRGFKGAGKRRMELMRFKTIEEIDKFIIRYYF